LDKQARPVVLKFRGISKAGFGIGSTTEALNLDENSKKIIDEMSQRTQQNKQKGFNDTQRNLIHSTTLQTSSLVTETKEWSGLLKP
jgi:hypothetical protein